MLRSTEDVERANTLPGDLQLRIAIRGRELDLLTVTQILPDVVKFRKEW